VRETAPAEAIAANPDWQAYAESVQVQEAELDDLRWADGLAFGTPTRYGNPAAQLKAFIDTTGGMWYRGELINKVATGFTSAGTSHGGLESTVLALNNVFYHWGAVVLPLGYTDPMMLRHGNPYGGSWVCRESALPDELTLDVCRHQGRRLAEVTRAMVHGLTPAHVA
jgi:NAD(P)H dehydrogenase (quinone)